MTKMFIMLIFLAFTNNIIAQAICLDDAQCADGQFCETSSYSCRRCLECHEVNRSPLPQLNVNACIKFDDECGPCLKSYVKNRRSKCVSPEEKNIFSPDILCVALAAVGLLISILFVLIIINTNVYEIAGYYIYKSPMCLETSAKQPVYWFKNIEAEFLTNKTQDTLVV